MKDLLNRMNLQLFAEGDNQEEQNPGDNQQQDTNNDIQDKPLTMDEVRKLIQSETDKVRTEYSKKLKEAQAEAERLAKEKMSEEEKAKYEQEKLQKELEEKERALLERELNLLAVELLNEAQMPLEFKEFVVGADEEQTREKVSTLKNLWNAQLEKAVQERFKEKGRDPYDTSGSGDTVKNPWSKEHFNLTEQGRLLRENPELAKQLMASANK